MPYRPALADRNAIYSENYELNIENLIPQISLLGSDENKGITAVAEREVVLVGYRQRHVRCVWQCVAREIPQAIGSS